MATRAGLSIRQCRLLLRNLKKLIRSAETLHLPRGTDIVNPALVVISVTPVKKPRRSGLSLPGRVVVSPGSGSGSFLRSTGIYLVHLLVHVLLVPTRDAHGSLAAKRYSVRHRLYSESHRAQHTQYMIN